MILPLIGFLDVELNLGLRFNTFPGNVLVRLMWPGYMIALKLFPESARNESAGIILFPAASLFNIIIYSLLLFALLTWFAGRKGVHPR